MKLAVPTVQRNWISRLGRYLLGMTGSHPIITVVRNLEMEAADEASRKIPKVTKRIGHHGDTDCAREKIVRDIFIPSKC